MLHTPPPHAAQASRSLPQFIAIRRDERGFGIRFGLTEAEDEVMKGPVFATLPEALDWIDRLDRLRGAAR